MCIVVISENPTVVHYVGDVYPDLLVECAKRWVCTKGVVTTQEHMVVGGYIISPHVSGEQVSVYIVSSDAGWITTQRKMNHVITFKIYHPLYDNSASSVVSQIKTHLAEPNERLVRAIEQLDNQTSENSRFSMRAACDIRDDIMRCLSETMSSVVSKMDDIADKLVAVSGNQEVMHLDQGSAVDDIKSEVTKVHERITSLAVDVGLFKMHTKREITQDDKKTLIDEIKQFNIASLRPRKL